MVKPLFEPTTLAPVRTATAIEPVRYALQPAPAGAVAPDTLVSRGPHAEDSLTYATRTVTPPFLDDAQITALGEQAAHELKGVSHQLLAHVRASDTAEFGQGLNQLVGLAKGLAPQTHQDQGLLSRLRNAFVSTKERMVSQYNSVEKQMEALTAELDKKVRLHEQRIHDLEQLYLNNFKYHSALDTAQDTCQSWLDRLRQQYEQQKARMNLTGFDAQVLADYERLLHRLDKRISDLERAKLLSKQVAPQIRIMQDDTRALVSAFGDVKAVTLPAWKNTFSLYILQLEQKQSAELLHKIGDATDQALRQSADLLRQNSIEIATARNRDVVSVDTLAHINTQLIGAVEDIKRIDNESRTRRQAEAPKLKAMEQALVQAFAVR